MWYSSPKSKQVTKAPEKENSFKKQARGSARWYRDGDDTLYLQWKVKKGVNTMSTIHKADNGRIKIRMGCGGR